MISFAPGALAGAPAVMLQLISSSRDVIGWPELCMQLGAESHETRRVCVECSPLAT